MSVHSSKHSTTSRASRVSRSSRASSSFSVVRRDALIENAASQTALESEQRRIEMAEKYAENERQTMEYEQQMAEKRAESERQRAANERQMSLLNATKAAAISKAKLDTIDQAFREENEAITVISDADCDSIKRTGTWISCNANLNQETDDEIFNNMPSVFHEKSNDIVPNDLPKTTDSCYKDGDTTQVSGDTVMVHRNNRRGEEMFDSPTPRVSLMSNDSVKNVSPGDADNVGRNTLIPRKTNGFAGNKPVYHPHRTTEPGPSSTEHRLVECLVRQNLPKFEPDVFANDVTLYYTWKNSFRAMLEDANVNPTQEIGFLRKYTSGDSQKVVDTYLKRLYTDPADAVRDIWSTLDRKFGNTAAITNAYLDQLEKTAKFKDTDRVKLQDFADTCEDVNSQLTHLPGLTCINYANVLQPIVSKLPTYLKTKWEQIVVDHANANDNAYPTFDKFANLMSSQADLKSHPNIQTPRSPKTAKCTSNEEYRFDNSHIDFTDDMRVYATTSEPRSQHRDGKSCPIHNRKGHTLIECPTFETYTTDERRDTVYKAGLCFRCLVGQHRAADCRAAVIKCSVCGSTRHTKLMHSDNWYETPNSENNVKRNNRERYNENTASTSNTDTKRKPEEVRSTCTLICDGNNGGTSCCKILLIDIFAENSPHISRPIYALIDDQSNASMISSNLIDEMGLDGTQERYLLTTCSKEKETRYGRRVTGLLAKSSDGTTVHLPSMIECDHIPQNKHEIATPLIAKQFPHLAGIADEIPQLNSTAGIEILIGRDAPELLKVRAFRNGPSGAPWGQQLILGWTISGQVCLDRKNGPVHIVAHKTEIADGTPQDNYDVAPCPNYFNVKQKSEDDHMLFHTSTDDDEIAFSNEDRRFVDLMDNEYHKNELGNCEMPLPFREGNIHMPNNRDQAMKRLRSLQYSFSRKPQMKDDYIAFMSKLFERRHAVVLSPNDEPTIEDGKFWYLPHFAVYHPKKPDQVRVVFDSSAEYKGTSLNKNLITGPDQMNNLLGILVRFRKENVGIICDVEQMFHTFHVNEEHRNFLRFLWFEKNDPAAPIVECRMNVHLFGNVSSPAIATYGMRRTADEGEEKFGSESKRFVHEDFYVDDGLTSCASETEALRLVKNTQASLKKSNLRLHKIASNSVTVMNKLPEEDRAKDLKELDLQHDTLPSLRSLGVQWNLDKDTFTFKVTLSNKPYTRRGILSVVNSVYDPIGLAAPVTIQGKIILQHLTKLGSKYTDKKLDWDDPLPTNMLHRWESWKNDLVNLEHVESPRCYHDKDFGLVSRSEIHAFSDASTEAIGVAIYLRLINTDGRVSVSLIYGQAKVAPIRLTTIPRLELCAAVMATQAVQKISKEIHQPIDQIYYYTDSKIVLGYIRNENRRFYVYVANRVQIIRNSSNPSQWKYVETKINPADIASRGIRASKLMESAWLKGPDFLKESPIEVQPEVQDTNITDDDPDVRPEVTVNRLDIVVPCGLGADRFERFSTWISARRALANVTRMANNMHRQENDRTPLNSEELLKAEKLLLTTLQRDAFEEDLNIINNHKNNTSPNTPETKPELLKSSRLYKLDPFVDEDGIIRVGGRLRHSDLPFNEKHPAILPRDHHLTKLVIRHYHAEIQHQGRTTTLAATRKAGFWVIGGQSAISKVINSCVVCRRLRGHVHTQHMADLPPDRLEVTPPFTNVGFDVFGPWTISTRKLRGGAAETKRWGLVFTCLSSRAVHIEVLESMDASSFICALRRFFALRGPAAILRCDRGTNFIGAKTELDESLAKLDKKSIERYVTEHGCKWLFNPPLSSHHGGVWERMIGIIRRVLDAMLLTMGRQHQLTHEMLTTLMSEVTAIVNARPITAVASDNDEPQPLSPAMLLTMKSRPYSAAPGVFVGQDLYARRRWRRTQYLADQFWARWRREYIQSLQIRQKWNETKRDITTGDIVIVVEDGEVPRYKWPLGRVVKATPSNDGHVRSVKVAIWKDGAVKEYERPITKCVVLLEKEKMCEYRRDAIDV